MATILNSTNRSKSSYIREVTSGTTPASPAFQEQRLTSMGLALDEKRERSKEVRSDGQAPGSYVVGEDLVGQIGGELSFKTHDDHFESALKGAWSSKPVRDNAGTADSVITDVAATGGVITVTTGAQLRVGHLVLNSGYGQSANNGRFRCSTASATVPAFASQGLVDEAAPAAAARSKVIGFRGASGDITATATGLGSTALDFTTLGINPGEWHWIGGATGGAFVFATAACRGWGRVQSVAATAIVYDVLPAGWTTDAGTSKTIEVYTPDFLKNGTTIYSYSWERQQQDLSGGTGYEYFRGCFIDKFSLPSKSGAELSVSADFVGLSGDAMGTTRASGATDVAATTTQTMTSYTNTLQVVEGGVSLINGVNCISESSFDIANNIERVQVDGGYAINVGEFTLSLKFDGYLGSPTILAKSKNDTLTEFHRFHGYTSGNREGYMLDAPAVRYSLKSDIPGKNQGRKVSGTGMAEPHATLGYTMSIQRFWYLPTP